MENFAYRRKHLSDHKFFVLYKFFTHQQIFYLVYLLYFAVR